MTNPGSAYPALSDTTLPATQIFEALAKVEIPGLWPWNSDSLGLEWPQEETDTLGDSDILWNFGEGNTCNLFDGCEKPIYPMAVNSFTSRKTAEHS